MLFNSFEFIFAFLPITLIGYFLLDQRDSGIGKRLKYFWLIIASLFFYSWWDLWNLPVIVASLIFNFSWGNLLQHIQTAKKKRKLLLGLGVFINIAFLGFYKYANFIIGIFSFLFQFEFKPLHIELPLAISFFTFQQITYLVDAYLKNTRGYDLVKYLLVVTFFPHLIAGPIVRHQEITPQLSGKSSLNTQATAIGLSIFVFGLFKKVVIADNIASFANLAFAAADQNVQLTFSEAWAGALAYTLQLYFDFSGYSDMAIGIASMFGVRFPINFNSPYKSISIIDFWRRWHITLSNFIRDYLYIPLGGNRQGKIRHYANLFITMLLGGLWHGAGWTFILWGAMHGLYLVINHGYRSFRRSLGHDIKKDSWLLKGSGWIITFLAIVIAWVFFRAKSAFTAIAILSSMFGFHGIQLPGFLESKLGFLRNIGIEFNGFTVNVGISQQYAVFSILFLLLVVWFAPNVYQIMGTYSPTIEQPVSEAAPYWMKEVLNRCGWRPNLKWSIIIGILFATCLLCFTNVSEFLYFQF